MLYLITPSIHIATSPFISTIWNGIQSWLNLRIIIYGITISITRPCFFNITKNSLLVRDHFAIRYGIYFLLFNQFIPTLKFPIFIQIFKNLIMIELEFKISRWYYFSMFFFFNVQIVYYLLHFCIAGILFIKKLGSLCLMFYFIDKF